MDELGTLSSANISKYAEKVGANYELLRGNVFRLNLSPQCQKLYMLDEVFDEYDTVVMLDIDVFTRKGMREDIFDENIKGIGMHTDFHDHIFKVMQRKFPHLTNPKYPSWGGAIYKLGRETRQKLRIHIKDKEMVTFSGSSHHDEGIMHRLATLAKLEKCCLPGGKHWCRGNFEEGVEQAAIIHIRTKYNPVGWKPGMQRLKRSKIENYRDLVKRGIIEE